LGKSIVVQMEQGLGDQFMFARFLPALKMLGASKVVVLAQQSMCKVLGQMECIDALTDLIEVGPAVECDYWIGSMSLPYYIDCSAPYVKNLFPITSKKIVGSEGYFHALPSNIPAKVGVQWESSKNMLRHVRTMKAIDMEKLVGYDAYSLNPEDDANFYPLPNDGWKKDWSKTAAHLKALKGLVTVDTGIAHIAGALGVKTIVLLPKEDFICWRWKNGRWYDSVVALRMEDYDQIPELLRRM
jgi:hypothetical protein